MLIEGGIPISQIQSYVNCADRYFPQTTAKHTLIDNSYIGIVWTSGDDPIGSLHIIDPLNGKGYLNKYKYGPSLALTQVQSFEFTNWTVHANHRSRSFVINISLVDGMAAQLAMIYYLDGADIQRIPFAHLDDLIGMQVALQPEVNDGKPFSIEFPFDFKPYSPFLFCSNTQGIKPRIDRSNDHIHLMQDMNTPFIPLNTFYWQSDRLFATSSYSNMEQVQIPTQAIVL